VAIHSISHTLHAPVTVRLCRPDGLLIDFTRATGEGGLFRISESRRALRLGMPKNEMLALISPNQKCVNITKAKRFSRRRYVGAKSLENFADRLRVHASMFFVLFHSNTNQCVETSIPIWKKIPTPQAHRPLRLYSEDSGYLKLDRGRESLATSPP
jgi:hypothetical protein